MIPMHVSYCGAVIINDPMHLSLIVNYSKVVYLSVKWTLSGGQSSVIGVGYKQDS